MKTAQALTDQLAIGLSLACAAHCVAIPFLLLLVPSMAILPLGGEIVHFWLVVAVIPSSVYALTMGCKRHKYYRLLGLGAVGLSLLVLALVLGEDRIGELGEKGLTLLGAGCIAAGHWLNYRLCRSQDEANCACTGDE